MIFSSFSSLEWKAMTTSVALGYNVKVKERLGNVCIAYIGRKVWLLKQHQISDDWGKDMSQFMVTGSLAILFTAR